MFATALSVSGQVGSEVDVVVVEGSAEPLFPQPGRERREREQKFPLDGAITRSKEEEKEEEEQGTPKRDRETERAEYIQVHSGEGGRCTHSPTHRKSSFPKLSNSSRWALGRREEGGREREGTNYSLVAHRINLPSSEAIRKDKERGERSPRNKKRWALVGIIYRVTMDSFGNIFY